MCEAKPRIIRLGSIVSSPSVVWGGALAAIAFCTIVECIRELWSINKRTLLSDDISSR